MTLSRTDQAYRAFCEARKGSPLDPGEFEALYSTVESSWIAQVLASLDGNRKKMTELTGEDVGKTVTVTDVVARINGAPLKAVTGVLRYVTYNASGDAVVSIGAEGSALGLRGTETSTALVHPGEA